MKRIDVMYLRKSQADLEAEKTQKFETLARHKRRLLALADEKGVTISRIYKELVSGDSIQNRPEMQRLLQDIRDGKINSVFVVEIQRLARGATKDQGIVAEAFKMTDTLIVTPDKTYDPNNEIDQQFFEFGLYLSRIELNFIKKRMLNGRLDSIKEGNYLAGHAPFGYDIHKPTKKVRTLSINEEEAKWVRQMFHWCAVDKLGIGMIAANMSRSPIYTRRGKKEWNRSVVKELLANHVYLGKVRWNYRRQHDVFQGDVIVKTKPRQKAEDWLIYEGKHEAIITQEIFDLAQETIASKYIALSKVVVSNELANLVKCSKCGRAMKKATYRTRPNHRTRLEHIHSITCKVKSTFFDDGMQAITEALKEYLNDFEIELSEKDTPAEMARYEMMRDCLKDDLVKLNKRKKNIMNIYEVGDYTRDEFKERKQLVEERILEINEQLDNLQPPNTEELEEKIVKISQVLASLDNDTISAPVKNQLLRGIIEEIIYSHDGEKAYFDVHLRP